VLEGERGTIRCQNRSSEGRFLSYISNAVWIRSLPDGRNITIETSEGGLVYPTAHTLNFNPISNETQGKYFCCLPDERTCSDFSYVRKSSKLNNLDK